MGQKVDTILVRIGFAQDVQPNKEAILIYERKNAGSVNLFKPPDRKGIGLDVMVADDIKSGDLELIFSNFSS
jgi:hypothetical protein